MSLYKLLGISKTATEQEIASSYRKLALQFHPDRNPNGADQFKKVNEAYTILSDPTKRASYDRTGVAPGSETAEDDEAQRSADIGKEVAEFYKVYYNSPEESEDIIKAYNATDGNLDEMVQAHLLFDNGVPGQVARIVGIVNTLLERGDLKLGKKWKKSSSSLRLKKLEEAMEEERREAEKALEKIHGDRHFNVSAAATSGDASSLQALIVARQKDRAASWNNFLDEVQAKYCTNDAKKGKKSKVVEAEPAKKKARKEK